MSSRDSFPYWTIPVICAGSFNLGLLLSGAVNESTGNQEARQRVKQVQVEYQQIHDRLSESYEKFGKLLLDDENKVFSFTVDEGSPDQQDCKSSYTVDNDTINIAGNIACTVSVTLQPTTTLLR